MSIKTMDKKAKIEFASVVKKKKKECCADLIFLWEKKK
jgi:hypothetical protein